MGHRQAENGKVVAIPGKSEMNSINNNNVVQFTYPFYDEPKEEVEKKKKILSEVNAQLGKMLYEDNVIKQVKLVEVHDKNKSEKSKRENKCDGVAACGVSTSCMAGSSIDASCNLGASVCTPEFSTHDHASKLKMLKICENGMAAFSGGDLVEFIHGSNLSSISKCDASSLNENKIEFINDPCMNTSVTQINDNNSLVCDRNCADSKGVMTVAAGITDKRHLPEKVDGGVDDAWSLRRNIGNTMELENVQINNPWRLNINTLKQYLSLVNP